MLKRFASSGMRRRPQAAVSCVVKVADKNLWLLVKRGKAPAEGKWSFPGGRIEFGEKAALAAARELSEEVPGLSRLGLSLDEQAFWSSDSISPNFHYVITQFFGSVSAQPASGEVEVSSDAAEARFFTAGEVANLETTGEAVGALSEVIEVASSRFPDR